MKLFLDTLYLLGQILAVIGLAWGAWLVLRDSLAGTVFPGHENSAPGASVEDHNQRLAERSVEARTRETRRAA